MSDIRNGQTKKHKSATQHSESLLKCNVADWQSMDVTTQCTFRTKISNVYDMILLRIKFILLLSNLQTKKLDI